jgi:hypothetical protein
MGGRDMKGMDCYGLLIEAMRILGHRVPDLWSEVRDAWRNGWREIAEVTPPGWTEIFVADSERGDVVLMRGDDGLETHLGVFVSDARVLTTFRGMGSVMLPVCRIAGRIVKVWRVED